MTGREKRRDVPLQRFPTHMVQAVLAIEDRRFYDHPGIDPIGIVGAVWEPAAGGRVPDARRQHSYAAAGQERPS